jgi:hypothetical protein
VVDDRYHHLTVLVIERELSRSYGKTLSSSGGGRMPCISSGCWYVVVEEKTLSVLSDEDAVGLN